MQFVKLFEDFLGEGSVNAMEVDFSNAPDAIFLKHKDGEIKIDLLGSTVKEIVSALEGAKKELSRIDGQTEIVAADENGDEDRGIGMEWTLPNGETIYGPDFGTIETAKEALSQLADFFSDFKKASSSLSREEKEEMISVNFD